MLKKKMKGVSIDSSPYAFDEETRTRFKHQSLMQDFHELQKETEAMKKKLHKEKQKKFTLLAEVRFLRRRYKFLMKNQSPKTPLLERDLARQQAPEMHREALRMPKPSPVLDLNQISNGEEEAGEFQVHEEPLRMEKKPKNYLIRRGDEQQQPSDVNLSVCREIVNGPNRSGKRKISWQDQVALKV
ncbi:hypothetical protein BVC80_1797g22 [Macleaya cordata]|uniref:Uncharacterized protein n=1 Tax=Macleaya cordata TaxID=56857 RepID=A0A200PSZ1_MACCD|nr:hypothetical protein BVC80_1797g22 [Macleaya cordata]